MDNANLTNTTVVHNNSDGSHVPTQDTNADAILTTKSESNSSKPEALPIFDINETVRESLGVFTSLPTDNTFELGRDSLSFNSDFVNLGKESLNFSNNFLKIDLRRESIMKNYLNGSEHRDSLGILKIPLIEEELASDECDVNMFLGKESLMPGHIVEMANALRHESTALHHSIDATLLSPKIPINNNNSGSSKSPHHQFSFLNTGFLQNSQSLSGFSNKSVSPSFHSNSLNEPSNIIHDRLESNRNGNDETAPSILEKGFCCADMTNKTLFELKCNRFRIQSLPVNLDDKVVVDNGHRHQSFNGVENESVVVSHDSSSDFADSVFIEANQMAEKLADGSIYNENSEIGKEIELAEQPEWPSIIEIPDEQQKPDKDNVFKQVDIMLPTNTTLDTKLKAVSGNNANNTYTRTEVANNGANITRTCRTDTSNLTKTSVATSPTSALSVLSECLEHKDDLTNSQRSEGLNLIHNLAALFRENNKANASLDDSGHSSIIKEETDNNVNAVKPENKMPGSVKKNQTSTLSGLVSKSPRVRIITQTPNSSLESNKSAGSNASNISMASTIGRVSSFSKLTVSSKPQPVSSTSNATTKKGPLKAIHPNSKDSENKKIATTPKRTSNEPSSNMLQSRRTSTPFREPKLMPRAASTPTDRPTRESKIYQTSPLAKPRISSSGYGTKGSAPMRKSTPVTSSQTKLTDDASSHRETAQLTSKAMPKKSSNFLNSMRSSSSGNEFSQKSQVTGTNSEVPNTRRNSLSRPVRSNSLNEFSGKPQVTVTSGDVPNSRRNSVSKPIRRNSISEINEKPTLKRNNSIGKEPKIMSVLSKVRENMINSPYFAGNRKSSAGSTESGSKVLAENREGSKLRRLSLMPVLKNAGKENAN